MKDFVFALFRTSVGRKAVMGLTGVGAIVYLVLHLTGNTFVFGGPDTYNTYAKGLHSLAFLPLLELGLLALFLVHISFGVTVTIQNWRARPIEYAAGRYRGIRSYAAKAMIFSGLLILVFIFFHLWDVRFGPGVEEMTVFERVENALKTFDGAAVYLVGFLAMAVHLTYGAASSLQSLGLRHAQHDAWVEWLGGICAWALALGYALIPLRFWSGG